MTVPTAPPAGQAEFVRGFEHHRAGRTAEAAAHYRAAIAANPRHVDALHLLGLLTAQAGNGDAAKNHESQELLKGQEIRCGRLHMDRAKRRCWLAQKELNLTPREFDLLWHFAKQPGRALSRADLLSQVWGYGHDGYEHTVNSHINRLRSKLGDACIQTVWGIGYRFEVPC